MTMPATHHAPAPRALAPARRHLLLGAGTLCGAVVLGGGTALAAPPTLRKGDRGAAVTTVQKRLNSLGYWCGTPDGHFGELTRQAVYALQKVGRLGRDGVMGPKTRSAMDRGIRPKARTTSGTAFEIDLARQLLICVSKGRVTYILNTSTGNGERYYSGGRWKTARTPRGTFSIYTSHRSGWQTGPLGRMYRPSYFRGGYAIHGSSSIPPYPASHGCARISVSSSDMLWRGSWFTNGRTVTVY